MIMKKYKISLLFLLLFETIAIVLALAKHNSFYFFNFSYIGCSVSLGLALMISHHKYARRIVQLLVGLYMLGVLGILEQENMQIEGFWFYLFSGTFTAATIHYAVAKIFGPLAFGRGWCGWACWTAMVLDFLPWKIPASHVRKNIGWIRYVLFLASFVFVACLFIFEIQDKEHILFLAFVAGNAIYYAVGILLAWKFKDNRAFCKYICPITVFLKPMSSHALIKVRPDPAKCVGCRKCEQVCPMDVKVLETDRSECILCMECARSCPRKAL